MRKVREYKKSVPVVCPDYTKLRETVSAASETIEQVRFEITPPADSHMFTTATLSREFKVRLVNRSPSELPVGDAPMHTPSGKFYINQSGLALQNTCESMCVSYNSTHLKSKPYLRVPWYTKLYGRSLAASSSASGRGFLFYSDTSEKWEEKRREIDFEWVESTEAGPFVFDGGDNDLIDLQLRFDGIVQRFNAGADADLWAHPDLRFWNYYEDDAPVLAAHERDVAEFLALLADYWQNGLSVYHNGNAAADDVDAYDDALQIVAQDRDAYLQAEGTAIDPLHIDLAREVGMCEHMQRYEPYRSLTGDQREALAAVTSQTQLEAVVAGFDVSADLRRSVVDAGVPSSDGAFLDDDVLDRIVWHMSYKGRNVHGAGPGLFNIWDRDAIIADHARMVRIFDLHNRINESIVDTLTPWYIHRSAASVAEWQGHGGAIPPKYAADRPGPMFHARMLDKLLVDSVYNHNDGDDVGNWIYGLAHDEITATMTATGNPADADVRAAFHMGMQKGRNFLNQYEPLGAEIVRGTWKEYDDGAEDPVIPAAFDFDNWAGGGPTPSLLARHNARDQACRFPIITVQDDEDAKEAQGDGDPPAFFTRLLGEQDDRFHQSLGVIFDILAGGVTFAAAADGSDVAKAWNELRAMVPEIFSKNFYFKSRSLLLREAFLGLTLNATARQNVLDSMWTGGVVRDSAPLRREMVRCRALDVQIDEIDKFAPHWHGEAPFPDLRGDVTNIATIKFEEPLVDLIFKPVAGAQFGCWSQMSDFLPRCADTHGRFAIDMKWPRRAVLESMLFARLESSPIADVEPGLEIIDSTSQLRVEYAVGSIVCPRVIPSIAVKPQLLGRVSWEKGSDVTGTGATREVSFSIQWRDRPAYFCFFVRRSYDNVYHQGWRSLEKTCTFDNVRLDVNHKSKAVMIDAKHLVDCATRTFFEEYVPVRNQSILVIPYHELPQLRVDSWQELSGTIRCSLTKELNYHNPSQHNYDRPNDMAEGYWENSDDPISGLFAVDQHFDIHCAVIYKNENLELQQYHAQHRIDLL